jgi:uncharacterized repeat protein (TIGR01451 family)
MTYSDARTSAASVFTQTRPPMLSKLLATVVRLVALAIVFPSAAWATATVNLSFTPATINPGDPSTLAVSIFNSGASSLTAAAITVNLAAGVAISATPGTTDSCGFTSASAPAGGTTIILSGGTVPAAVSGGADGSCTFTVSVGSTTPGNHSTTVPADGPSNGFTPGGLISGFSAVDGGSTITNATAATATLAVNTLTSPTGAMLFAPSPVFVGEVTRLTITLTNNDAATDLPLTSFTDTLPAGMAIAPTPNATVICAGGSPGTLSSPSVPGTVTPGDSSLTLTGGTIAAGSGQTCVIGLNVVAPSTPAALTDTVPANAIGNTRGLASAAFNRPITVSTPVVLSESFAPVGPLRVGSTATLTLRISNSSAANALDITSFTDNLSAGLTVAASPASSVACTGAGAVNGTLTATAGSSVVTLASAVAGPAGHCTVSVPVLLAGSGTLTSTAATTVVAGTQMTNAAVAPANLPVPAASANIVADSQFTVAKSAAPLQAYRGQTVVYTVTISNWSPGVASNVNFTDTLPIAGGVQMTLSAGSSIGAGCSGGSVSAVAGSSAFTWTGGTIVAGAGGAAGTCAISLVTSVPLTATVGTAYINTLPANTAVTGTDVNSTAIHNTNGITATVTVISSVGLVQAFAPATIFQGAASTLTVTLTNPTATALTNTAFSETFNPAVFVAPVPLASTTCAGSPVITAAPGAASFSVSGLTIPAGGNCRVSVSTTSALAGSFTSTILANAISDDQSQSNSAPASALLKVNTPITASASFNPSSTGLNGSSQLTVTVTNNGASALSGLAITSPLQTGANAFVVAAIPAASTTCAGSPSITATPGATSVSLTGATLAAGTSCALSFAITTTAGGSWTFTLPIGNITTAEGPTNTAAVAAVLTKVAVALGINKSFSPNSINGGTPATLRIDITNPLASPSASSGVAVTDNFPSGMQVYATPSASTTCTNGTVSAIAGDSKASLAGADIPIGATCSVFVNVTSVKPLNLTNTIGIGAISSQQGFTNTVATSATLSTLQGLGVEKTFSPTAVSLGQVSRLALTLVSTLNAAGLTNVAVTDNLPAGLLVAPVPNVASTCNTAPSPAPGAASVSIAGVTLAAQTNCTVQVDVIASTPGPHTNTIPVGGATSSEGYSNQTSASAVLNVLIAPTVGLAFAPNPVPAGASSALTISLGNSNGQALTASALTVPLPAGLTVALTPNASTTCGGSVVATAAASSITLNGATIPANGSCTFKADVSSNTPASYATTVAVGALSTAQGASNTAAANATLTVLQFPTVAQSLSLASIAPGGTSRLTLTLGNPNATPLTLSSPFVDTLPVSPGNLVIATPSGLNGTCTLASVTAAAGAGTVTYASGAAIPAGGCTISVNVTANVVGSYVNALPAGALRTNAGNSQSASSVTLTVASNTPPTANAVTTTAISSTASTPQAITAMSGTAFSGATITTYTVASLPTAGTLYCTGTAIAAVPTNCAANGLTFKPSGAVPNPVTFTYTVTDSNGLVSTAATYTIPLNVPPTAANFSNAVNNNAVAPRAIGPMSGAAQAGASITTYTVTALPASSTLYCSGTAIASVPSNCAAAGLSIRPIGNPTGSTTLSYTVTDSNGLVSSPATGTINWNAPPTAANFSNAVNNNAVAPRAIGPMSGAAQAGASITTYTVTALPASSTLYCSGTAIASVPSNCAAAGLSILPVGNPTGSTTLSYTVTDSNGLTSGAATGSITWNTPPTASAATDGPLDNATPTPQALPPLVGTATTTGATITAYTVVALPSASSGVLYCAGTPLNAVPAGCAAGALALRVTAGATGPALFSFTVTDSNLQVSAPATVTVTFGSSPAITIHKQSSGPMTVGFAAVYTLQVSNRSPYTATRAPVVVTDTLPVGLDFVSAAGTRASSGWSCLFASATRQLSCTSGVFIPAAADAEPIALHVTPNASALGGAKTAPIANTAVVAGGGETPAYANGTAPGAQPHSSTDTQTVQASATISGSIWIDANHNGLKDPGEPPPAAGSIRVQAWPAGTSAAQFAAGTPITTVLIDASGRYTLTVAPATLLLRFVDASSGAPLGNPVNGETAASRNQPSVTSSSGVTSHGTIDNIQVAPGASITQQSLPLDPQGIVYDSGTRTPIGGASVLLLARGQAVPSSCLAGGPNPYVTAASGTLAGSYQFLIDYSAPGCASLSGATFTLRASAPGYRSPSALIPPGAGGQALLTLPAGAGLYAVVPKPGVPAAGDPTTYYLALVLSATAMGPVNNNIPLDGAAQAGLAIAKVASRAAAEIGDTVRYTVTVTNSGKAVLPAVQLTDRLPLGFKLIHNTATVTLGGAPIAVATPSAGPVLTFALPGLPPGTQAVLQYLVRIGVGADHGDGTNRIQARAGGVTSNEATATVNVSGGVFGATACLAGKVFMDCNGNGIQDPGEPGVPAVRVWLETGVSITTDAEGRFSFCGLSPRSHVLRIDRSTLPAGTSPRITSNRNLGDPGSLLLDPKDGELVRADFALGSCAVEIPPPPKHPESAPDRRRPPRIEFESPSPQAGGGP